ncbi:MAG: molecular chaperone TorD family protein [Pirellulaceae bacterium]
MESFKSLLDAYAEILLYPEHDHKTRVQTCIDQFTDDNADVREMVVEYLSLVDPLSLSEMEELYIRTFDLNKAGTLDLGWHLFGEDYNRGLFLVKLRQYLRLLEIPESNELPDHVSQVLRVLGRMSRNEANQFAYACVIPALETIEEGIQDDNPHGRLVRGSIQLLKSLFEVPAGFEEVTESEYASPFVQLPVIQ